MNTHTDLPEHFGPAAPEPITGLSVKLWENKDDTQSRVVVSTDLAHGSTNNGQAFASDDPHMLRSLAILLLQGAEALDLAESRRARTVATLTAG